MNVSIPLYIERLPGRHDSTRYRLRPLFAAEPQATGEDLNRSMNELALALRRHLHELGKSYRHEALAEFTFCPDLDYHRLDLTLELRSGRARCTFLFVVLEGFGRRLAFTPSWPDVWFEVPRGATLPERATEALTGYFREREKKDEEDFEPPQRRSLRGRAWVTTLDLEIDPAQVVEPPRDSFACLGGPPPLSGAAELEHVGRCLDHLYPTDLQRAVLREAEVEELSRLLGARDQRPVLLLGPRLVGKTTLVHEYVYRTVSRRQTHHQLRQNVWLLSPQRLISGMSYVGQWENRLLAILKEVKKRDHLVYLDDLLGLYHAGVSRDADLSVAQVLKPYVERREVRLLAEITPEALRVLREKDRGFADLFHVLPVREPSEHDNLRILIEVMRQLEDRHRCRFNLEVLPTVLDLQRRYLRGVASPGKAATFLTRLAVQCHGADVTRDQVLRAFHARSGLTLAFLDGRTKLERAQVREALAARVIGQGAALDAAADVVAIARARLNDPDRPLASFLFLGPTGVGKTQTAKALAAYLFGDAERLVRFDMNEFGAPGAAARLVGTFYSPEGLLTSAVRRQPFAVILLDEIEKAHPDVLDLLLQVLGEGRLTDALGRVADFTNTIIVLTSNLGVRAVENRLGFQQEARDRAAYIDAAEKFFRPEFFNRLDRIVPFERLSLADIGQIARLLIREVFQREGLLRRRCLLQVEGSALERVVDLGYDPVLGARALKRAMERQLTQPVAAYLAAGIPEALTVVTLFPRGDLIAVGVQALTEVARRPTPAEVHRDNPLSLLDQVDTAVDGIESRFASSRPVGVIEPGRLGPEHYHYFAIQEQVGQVRASCRQLREEWLAARQAERPLPAIPLASTNRKNARWRTWDMASKTLLLELAETQDMHAYFQELAARALPAGEKFEDHLAELLQELALLHAVAAGCGENATEQVLLHLRPLEESEGARARLLAELYQGALADAGLEALLLEPGEGAGAEQALLVRGPHALALTQVEKGTQLFCPAHAGLVPVQVMVLPLAAGEEPRERWAAHREARQRWLEALAAGTAPVEEDPYRLLPVLRLYEDQGPTVDLRSGLLALWPPTARALRGFILAALPLPSGLQR